MMVMQLLGLSEDNELVVNVLCCIPQKEVIFHFSHFHYVSQSLVVVVHFMDDFIV